MLHFLEWNDDPECQWLNDHQWAQPAFRTVAKLSCRQSIKQSIHDHNLQQQIAKSADCMLNHDLYLSEMLDIAAGLESHSNLILPEPLSILKNFEYINIYL